MKKNICLLVLCIASLCVVAQETKELKQVKLKSGISISGYVTNNTDGSISVTTVDGDQLWYSTSELESITDDPSVIEARRKAEAETKARAEEEKRKAQEEEELAKAKAKADAAAAKTAKREAIKMKEKGVQFMVEFGYGVASNIYNYFDIDSKLGTKVSFISCYRFNKHLLTGIGIGYKKVGWNINSPFYLAQDYIYHRYDYSIGEGPSIFAKIAYNFKAKRVTPYIGMNAGYSLLNTLELYGKTNGWYKYDWCGDPYQESVHSIDSFFFEGDMGLMFRTRKGSGLNLGLSLTYSLAPSSVHGIKMNNALIIGAIAGWTF